MNHHAQLTEPGWFGPAPALIARSDRPVGTVVLLHGLHADALANLRELTMLQGAGFHAIGLDAPGHGRRYDPTRASRYAADARAAIAAEVRAATDELPSVLDALEEAGFQAPFGLVGISFGAFVAWRAAPRDPRIRAVVAMLGAPVLPGGTPPDPGAYDGCAVLAIQAGRDELVPLAPSEAMVHRLVERGVHARLDVLVDAPHTVPEPGWWWAWGNAVGWLHTHLVQHPLRSPGGVV